MKEEKGYKRKEEEDQMFVLLVKEERLYLD